MRGILFKNWDRPRGKELIISPGIQKAHCFMKKCTNSSGLYCKKYKRVYKNSFSPKKIIKTITLCCYCRRRRH